MVRKDFCKRQNVSLDFCDLTGKKVIKKETFKIHGSGSIRETLIETVL